MKNFFSKNKNLTKLSQKGDEFYLPSQQALFWRQSLLWFFISLIFVLIVYLIFLWLVLLSGNGGVTLLSVSASSTSPVLDQKKVNQAISEIKNRQKNFEEIASSTPTLVDPSL